MEPEKTPEASSEPARAEEPQAPADALSRTPEELAEDTANSSGVDEHGNTTTVEQVHPEIKQPSPVKRFFRRVNVYFLIFLLILAIAAVIVVVNYLNSQKPPVEPSIATQTLTEETLKQLANTDATVGGLNQTLTIQGNAVIAGQTLMRGNLNVAGNLQTGGSLQAPSLTISGTTNLNEVQINSLQVANNTAIQGTTTLRDLNVAGTSSLSGAVTASQITVTKLIMSGNASLEIPNHISFTGPSPGRAINAGVLGSGGSASINGSDTTGTINVNTGNGPKAGCFIQITFSQAFSNQPHVIISPVGSAAANTTYYVDRDKNGFSVCTNTPAPANSVFAFDYFVTN